MSDPVDTCAYAFDPLTPSVCQRDDAGYLHQIRFSILALRGFLGIELLVIPTCSPLVSSLVLTRWPEGPLCLHCFLSGSSVGISSVHTFFFLKGTFPILSRSYSLIFKSVRIDMREYVIYICFLVVICITNGLCLSPFGLVHCRSDLCGIFVDVRVGEGAVTEL